MQMDVAATVRTSDLAAWSVGARLEDVPEHVRSRIIDLLIDALACALPASRSEEMGMMDDVADMFGSGSCTVIGDDHARSAGGATIANSYRITALTACDVYTPAQFHVTPLVVPPALAYLEEHGGSGTDLLLALATGFEVATRVAASLDYPAFRARGWHSPGVAGPFGSAAAVSRLMGLDESRTTSAYGLAGAQAGGTYASWRTPAVKFHQARGALAGLMAATLAGTGFKAAADVLGDVDGGIWRTYSDGGNPAALTAELGDRWELSQISIRLWPGATPLQPVLKGIFGLLAEGSVPADASITIYVAPRVHKQHAAFKHPQGTFEAMLSIEYATAVARHHGRLGFAEFLPEVYEQSWIESAIDLIDLQIDPDLSALQCRIEVAGGESVAVDRPIGHPDAPASREAVVAKFRTWAQGVLSGDRITEILELVEGIEELDDVRRLGRLLRTDIR